MKKKVIIVASIIIVIISILYILFFSKGKKDEFIRTTGIVEGTEVNLSSKVSGKISKVCCNEGDTVKEGSVVIRLESADVTASVEQAQAGVERAKADVMVSETTIENSKAALESAEAEIKNAEAEVEKTRFQLEEAKRQMERAQSLHKEDFISKADLDLKTTNYDTAVSTYDASKAKLNAVISRKDVAEAQLNNSLSQLASFKARLKEAEAVLSYQRARLNDTIIKTPITGTVVFKAVEKGETISIGAAILTIVDLQNLWVRVDMEETVIGSISLGDDVIISTEGMKDKTLKGKISEIGRYAEFATQKDVTRGRQDIKTFRVKINVEDTSNILKPGMTVSVEMSLKK